MHVPCVHVCRCACVHVQVCMCACVHVYMCHVCMCACACAMCASVHVCRCAGVQVHVCSNKIVNTNTQTITSLQCVYNYIKRNILKWTTESVPVRYMSCEAALLYDEVTCSSTCSLLSLTQKQARWLDITIGKFELTQWHTIAEEWFKEKPRNSDQVRRHQVVC